MLVPGTWTWPETIPVMAVAVALLFVPGLGAALLLRARIGLAFALAPVLSTGIMAIGGIVFGALDVRWSTAAALLAVAGAWALCGLIGVLARALLGRTAPPALDADPDPASEGRTSTWLLGRTGQTVATVAGVAFAFCFFAWLYLRSAGSPEAFPQQPDTITHLALPQWMINNGDISFFHALGFSTGVESGGYPVGWHVMTATLSMLTGAPVVVATSAFVVVVAGVVWPLGMAVLARTLFGSRPEVGALGAVTSVLFNGYPFLQVVLGVLWPNFFGQALMPGVLAITFVAVRDSFAADRERRALLSWVLVVLATPGLAMAHFNSWVAYLVFAWLMLLVASVLRTRRAGTVPFRWLPLIACLGIAAFGAAASAVVAPQGMLDTGAPGPEKDMLGGLVDTLFFSPHGTTEMLVAAPLLVLGAIFIWRRFPSAVWVVLGCLVFMALYFVSVTIDSPLTRFFTWPWYNISHRLAAIGVLPAVLLLTAGILALVALLTWRSTIPLLRTLTAAALVGLLFAGTGGYRHGKFEAMARQFEPKPSLSWASPDELRALAALSRQIPEGSTVAANPWDGATYLYVVSGRPLLWPTEKANTTDDRQLLGLSLDDIGTDPDVCAAAQRQGVEYAITGGQSFAWGKPEDLDQYAGVDDVGSSPAWEQIATEKPFTLYRLVSCAS